MCVSANGVDLSAATALHSRPCGVQGVSPTRRDARELKCWFADSLRSSPDGSWNWPPHRERPKKMAVPCREAGAAVISKRAYLQGLSWGVLFSRSAVSDSLRPHGLQNARLPRPSPSPGACSNSCPSRRWCHSTIPSSVLGTRWTDPCICLPEPYRFVQRPALGSVGYSALHCSLKAESLQMAPTAGRFGRVCISRMREGVRRLWLAGFQFSHQPEVTSSPGPPPTWVHLLVSSFSFFLLPIHWYKWSNTPRNSQIHSVCICVI